MLTDTALRLADIHPIEQNIVKFTYDEIGEGNPFVVCVGGGEPKVTKIEQTYKAGEYSHIPYIRVWASEICLMEICQHKVHAIYFESESSL